MNKKSLIFFTSDKSFETFYSAFLKSPEFDLKLLVTESPKPKGRGLNIANNPAHLLALRKNVDVFSGDFDPKGLAELVSKIKKIKDSSQVVGFVFAFGKIIPQELIDIFDGKILNLHPSLLPKYRGPSPIQTAIIEGEKESGFSIIEINNRCDAGDIVYQERVAMSEDGTYCDFRKIVIDRCTARITQIIADYLEGKINPLPQSDGIASYTKKIEKSDAEITKSDSPSDACRKIRAYCLWPKAFIILGGKRLIIHEASLKNDQLVLHKIQLEGKNILTAKDFANGRTKLLTSLPEYVSIG